jgi:hypothetical protein
METAASNTEAPADLDIARIDLDTIHLNSFAVLVKAITEQGRFIPAD